MRNDFPSDDAAIADGARAATETRHLWTPIGPSAPGPGYARTARARREAELRAHHRELWWEAFWDSLPSESPLHARRARPLPADGHAELTYALGGLSAAAPAAGGGQGGVAPGWRG